MTRTGSGGKKCSGKVATSSCEVDTWRIIPVRKWLKTMVNKSPPKKKIRVSTKLRPRKLTWNLKIMLLMGISSSNGSFSGFMLVFGGVNYISSYQNT